MRKSELLNASKENLFNNKYSLLLITLILILLISPFVGHYPAISFFADSILFISAILFVSRIQGGHTAFFYISVPLACFAVIFHFLTLFVAERIYFTLPALLFYMTFLAMAIIFLLRRIFSEKRVTGDTVKGSISVYILIGYWWQMLYTLIWALYPASFSLQIARIDSPDFFYFSFTTITTLGYGDVIPKGYFAKTAAILEAIFGQIYLAVLVARLVSLHVSHSGLEPSKKEDGGSGA